MRRKTAFEICGSVSNQGNVCTREPHHPGCHEAFVSGDSRRWWGDARWAPWEWVVYEWHLLSAARMRIKDQPDERTV